MCLFTIFANKCGFGRFERLFTTSSNNQGPTVLTVLPGGQYRKANYVFPDCSWYQYVQILQDHLLGKELKVELLSLKGPWYLLLITATITNNHMSHSQQRVQCQLWSVGLLLGK